MKELDFLPEWYKDDCRRKVHVRRQYVALVVIFLMMMTFNVTAVHRASRAAAEGRRLENQRVGAEAVVHEFDGLTQRLNELKTKASLVEQMDSRIDVAAIVAELSHLIDDSVVLRKLEIRAEPFDRGADKGQTKGAVVRMADKPSGSSKQRPLGRARFRIVLTGVAARPADVPDLVCRLDASAYFQRVHPLFYGNARTQTGARPALPTPEGGTTVKPLSVPDLTEFEIACDLANYKEMED
jgi:hypothetical protein